MKKVFYILAVTTAITVGISGVSCNSPSKKVEKAKENVQDAQMDLIEKKADAKIATIEEWNSFKSESEIKIEKNNVRIAELKAKIMKPGTGQKIDSTRKNKIVELEQQNNNLKAKINSYESNKSDWDSFKREFNNDTEELGKAFDDFTIDNNK